MDYRQRTYTPEEQEQITLMEWIKMRIAMHPKLSRVYHTPNGGFRAKATAAKLKAMGVKPGVPDITLPVPRGIYHGLYIELKTDSGKTSKEQNEWLAEAWEDGYYTAVCYSWPEAAEVLERYLSLPCVNLKEMLKACVRDETYQKCVMGEDSQDGKGGKRREGNV